MFPYIYAANKYCEEKRHNAISMIENQFRQTYEKVILTNGNLIFLSGKKSVCLVSQKVCFNPCSQCLVYPRKPDEP